MKKTLIPLLALAAAAVAVPASAQYYGGQHYGPGPRAPGYDQRGHAPMAARAGALYGKVDFAQRARVMSTGKAREFRRDIEELVRLEARYRAEGRGWEGQRALERRYQTLDRALDRYLRDAQRRRW